MDKLRSFLCSVLVASLFLSPSCKEDDSELLRKSKQLASEFHKAVMVRDVENMSELVLYPFNFDNALTVKERANFKKKVTKKLSGMQGRMRSARSMEAITYASFINGHEIRGKKFEGEEAERQAKKLNFKAGDVLVRCFAVDENKKEDGRDYFVVLRANDLGDLKIHTYFD